MPKLFSLVTEFENALFVDGRYESRKWKSNKTLREKINESSSAEFESLEEKIWALKTSTKIRPRCRCGSHTNFVSVTAGYRRFCGKRCAATDEVTQTKRQITSNDRWGGHHTRNSKWQQEFVDRCKTRGSYEKMQYTFSTKYGVSNRFALPKVKEAIAKSNLAKYGVVNPMQNSDVRNKMKRTCLSRYGVEHPMQCPQIFDKCQEGLAKSRYALKSITMPSGAIRKVQGYEPFIIGYYLQAGITEEDLLTDKKDVPVISYEFEGKKRIYYPDVFIKSRHLLIEVKSTYTWQKEIDKNVAKHLAAVEAGYQHSIVIWDAKHNRIHTII